MVMRILLVEDNEGVARFVNKGLKEAGYAVDWITRGDEAGGMLKYTEYDLMILDLMLPGIGGFEILRNLREQERSVPVLILSAKDQLTDKVKGLDYGADDYLTKPFAFAELLARVRALLRRSLNVQPPVLTVADLELDPMKRSVTRNGRRIDLTSREFSLLEFLMVNADRVISRTSAVEHVWEMHFDPETNLVDVYIRKLRNKLEEQDEKPLIQTVRGVGYVLRDET